MADRIIHYKGRTIQVPGHFTDAQIQQVLTSQGAQQPSETQHPDLSIDAQPSVPTEAPPDTGVDYQRYTGGNPITSGVASLFNLFGPEAVTRGAAEGVLDLADVANPVGYGIRPPLAESVAEPIFGPAEDMSGREQLGRSAVRFGVGAGVPAGGLANMERAAAPARSVIGRIVQKFAKPYAEQPAKTVAGDISAGAGAGAGMESYDDSYVDQVVPESLDPIAKILVGLVTGTGAAAGTQIGTSMLRGAKNAARSAAGLDRETALPFNQDTGEFFRSGDVNDAASVVQQRASNPQAAASSIEQAQSGLDYSPLPTSGSLSDDVGLGMMENKARRANPTPFVERDRQVSGQVSNRLNDMTPVDPETGQAMTGREFTDYGERLQRERVGQAQSNLETAHRGRETLARERAREGSEFSAYGSQAEDANAAIDRSVVDENLRPMQERSSELYGAVDPSHTATVNVDSLVDRAEAVRDSLGNLNTPSKVIPRGLLARIERTAPTEDVVDGAGNVVGQRRVEGAEVSVGEIADVMPELATTETRARQAGNYTLADNIRALRAEMKGILADEADAGNEAAIRFQEAEQNYAETTGEAFGRGPGDEGKKFRKDFNLDRQNRTTTPPSQTANRFLKPGQPEKAQSLVRAGAREQDIRRKLLADAARSGVTDNAGAIDPQRLQQWRNRWGATIDQFPQLSQEIDDTIARARTGQDADTYFAERIRQAEFAVSDAERNTGALKFVLGKDPESAVKAALESGDSERAFADLAHITKGNERAREGLKASVVDYLKKNAMKTAVQKTDTPGLRPVSWNDLDKVFQKHERALAEVFSPEEMQSLQQMHRVLRSFKNLELGATPGSQTAERFTEFLRNFEVGAKAYWGVLKGGGIVRTMRLAIKQFGPKANGVDQILSQMWFDPDLARHLLTREVPKEGAAYNRKLLKLLVGGEAARTVRSQEKESPAEDSQEIGEE